ncbi:HAD-IB family phosphatase [bacterium]|nr:HAD-IB family phosphatase [bacterium]
MLQKVDVVIFDFDGTLSAGDSNMAFGKYCFTRSVRPWLFIPMILAAWVGKQFNPRGIWWRQTMRRFLTADMVKRLAPDFIRQHRTQRFGWAADQVRAERDAGRRVILVSAGPDYLIPALVRDMKFDAVLCSQMDAARPWKYKFLCWGPNKVIAAEPWARDNKLVPRIVRSYSDSLSDMPVMDIADEAVWVDRQTGCRVARGK